LPTRTAFVPLVHGMVGYAARLATAAQRPGASMPEPVSLVGREEDDGATLTLTTPDGQERVARYARNETLTAASYVAYTLPGIYRITTPVGADFLAVNGTRAESHFEKIASADLQARLQPLPVTIEAEEATGQTGEAALPARELAGLVLVLLVAVLAVENVCANRL